MNENCEIIKELGVIGRSRSGYTKRLVMAKWFDHPPKYEIRSFSPEGEPLKLASMTPEELENLTQILMTVT